MSSEESFFGVAVLIYMPDPAGGGLLENVSLRKIAGHDFLVGLLADLEEDSDPRAGNEVLCALDQVQMMIRFQDIQDALRYCQSFSKKKRKHTKRHD